MGRMPWIIALAAGLAALAAPLLAGYPAEWSLAIGAAGAALGSASILVYVRRLLFAAASAPHAAFFAASLSIAISASLGGPRLLWTIIVGLSIVYLLGYMAHRGMDPDDATALVVSASSSLGVLTSLYVLSKYSYGSSVIGIVMGDPLLAGRGEVLAGLAVAIAAVTITLLAAREIAYIGLDRDDALLSGVRVWLYDLALYTLLGLVVMGLVRIVGFVVEHVLLLLPGAIAARQSSSGHGPILASIAITVLASGLGLIAAILFDLAPSGVIGLIIVAIYLVALWRR